MSEALARDPLAQDSNKVSFLDRWIGCEAAQAGQVGYKGWHRLGWRGDSEASPLFDEVAGVHIPSSLHWRYRLLGMAFALPPGNLRLPAISSHRVAAVGSGWREEFWRGYLD